MQKRERVPKSMAAQTPGQAGKKDAEVFQQVFQRQVEQASAERAVMKFEIARLMHTAQQQHDELQLKLENDVADRADMKIETARLMQNALQMQKVMQEKLESAAADRAEMTAEMAKGMQIAHQERKALQGMLTVACTERADMKTSILKIIHDDHKEMQNKLDKAVAERSGMEAEIQRMMREAHLDTQAAISTHLTAAAREREVMQSMLLDKAVADRSGMMVHLLQGAQQERVQFHEEMKEHMEQMHDELHEKHTKSMQRTLIAHGDRAQQGAGENGDDDTNPLQVQLELEGQLKSADATIKSLNAEMNKVKGDLEAANEKLGFRSALTASAPTHTLASQLHQLPMLSAAAPAAAVLPAASGLTSVKAKLNVAVSMSKIEAYGAQNRLNLGPTSSIGETNAEVGLHVLLARALECHAVQREQIRIVSVEGQEVDVEVGIPGDAAAVKGVEVQLEGKLNEAAGVLIQTYNLTFVMSMANRSEIGRSCLLEIAAVARVQEVLDKVKLELQADEVFTGLEFAGKELPLNTLIHAHGVKDGDSLMVLQPAVPI